MQKNMTPKGKEFFLGYGLTVRADFYTDSYSGTVTTLWDMDKSPNPEIILGPIFLDEGTSKKKFKTINIIPGTGSGTQGHKYKLTVTHYRNRKWKENRYKVMTNAGPYLKIGTEDMPAGDPGEDWNDIMVEFHSI
jgi:hypothetical protein